MTLCFLMGSDAGPAGDGKQSGGLWPVQQTNSSGEKGCKCGSKKKVVGEKIFFCCCCVMRENMCKLLTWPRHQKRQAAFKERGIIQCADKKNLNAGASKTEKIKTELLGQGNPLCFLLLWLWDLSEWTCTRAQRLYTGTTSSNADLNREPCPATKPMKVRGKTGKRMLANISFGFLPATFVISLFPAVIAPGKRPTVVLCNIITET